MEEKPLSGHSIHMVCPVRSWYVLAGHSEQSPFAKYHPAGHGAV